MSTLLAVDLGVKTGWALFGDNGRLLRYGSHNFGTPARLKRGAAALLNQHPDLLCLVVEGGGPLRTGWERAAERRGVEFVRVAAETWRRTLLYPRQHRSGPEAKRHADELARRVIAWSDAPRPTSLRHDAAEAVLIGLWGVQRVGWLTTLSGILR